MEWEQIKIAYAPYNKDLLAPGDRRRFIFYANERKIKFSLADLTKKYDVVYLTYGSNVSAWIKYKKKNPEVKFIFELIDSYLLEDPSFQSIFRGLAWYLLGKEDEFWLNYKTALKNIISISDAVVCSTQLQKTEIEKYNKNVHVSLDYFSNDITNHKVTFSNRKKIKLVWEGQAYTVVNLLTLNDVFDKFKSEIELYIITDLVIKSPIKIFSRKTDSILKKLKCEYKLFEWDKNSFSKVISEADLAIIPIKSNTAMMWNKPENKLLLLWEIGIPTLTSDTPEYMRVMKKAKINYCCATSNEWRQKIREYMLNSIDDRQRHAKKASEYIESFHNKNDILIKWDLIFKSINLQPFNNVRN